MKTHSEDLIELFRSLTKAEKLALNKLLNHNYKDLPSHLFLLQILDVEKKYNEELIIQKMGVKATQFAVVKNQAYKFLLDFIHNNTSESCEIEFLHKQQRIAELLFRKGLYSQSLKIVKKIKPICVAKGAMGLVYDLNVLENNLLREELDFDIILEYSRNKYELSIKAEMSLVLEMRHYYNILNTFFLRREDQLTEDEKRELIHVELLIKSSKIYQSDELERLRLMLTLLISVVKRSSGVISQTKQITAYFESKQSLLEDNFHEYMMVQTTIGFLYIKTGNTNAQKALHQKTFNILESKKLNLPLFIKQKFKQRINNLLFQQLLENAEWESLDDFFEEFLGFFQTAESNLGSLDFMWACHFLSYYYFTNENFDKAHYWIYKMIHTDYYSERKMSHPVTRIYCLILHYEMGNLDLLENTFPREVKYFQKTTSQEEIEQTLLIYLGKSLQNPTDTEIFVKLKAELNHVTFKKYLTTNIQDVFNLDAWIESKYKAKPFKELINQIPWYFSLLNPFIQNKEKLPDYLEN